MEYDRVIQERMGLRVIRILTNMLMLMGTAAAAAIFVGTPAAHLAAVCLLMAVLALAADQIQHRIRSFPLYTALCLLLLALTAGLGRLAVHDIWLILSGLCLMEILCLYGGRVRQRPAFVPRPGFLVLPMFIWMLGTFGGIPDLRALAFAVETGLVLLFMAWHNQKSLEHTYVSASERTRVPYGKIRRLNTGLLSIYLAAALLLCMGLTALCSGDEMVFLIPRAMVMLFGLLVGGLLWLIVTLTSWMSGGKGTGVSAIDPFHMEEAEALFPWLRTLWAIVGRIFTVACLALMACLIWRSLYDLYFDFLAADPETGDTRKRTNSIEKRRKRQRKKAGLPFFADFSPAAGIRRAYSSLIRSFPGCGQISESFTPSQIERAAAGEEAVLEEDWQEIHRLYEKARYAPETADWSDLRKMRELTYRKTGKTGSKPAGQL